jgi:hypothetical protein
MADALMDSCLTGKVAVLLQTLVRVVVNRLVMRMIMVAQKLALKRDCVLMVLADVKTVMTLVTAQTQIITE